VPTGPWFCRKCESQERAARVVRPGTEINLVPRAGRFVFFLLTLFYGKQTPASTQVHKEICIV
jgi:hypothetical protein